MKKKLVVIAAAAAVALGGLTLGVTQSASASADAPAASSAAVAAVSAEDGLSTEALYQKHVKSNTSSIRVFTSPNGDGIYGYWGPCTNFYTDRNDGGRYHTWVVVNGVAVNAWVTADSAYVADGWC